MSANADSIRLTESPEGVVLSVKVVPGASRTRIAGVYDGALRVAIAAPPEAGKANFELLRFLAKTVGVKRQALAITAGTTSAHKTLRVTGVDAKSLLRALTTALAK